VRMASAVQAATEYLDEAVQAPGDRAHWQSHRDDAYRLAHQARAGAEAAVAEPPPVSALAVEVIPAASELEDVVDAVTAVATARDVGDVDPSRVDSLRAQLERLRHVGQ